MIDGSPDNALDIHQHDTKQLDALTQDELDRLPVGAIRVDADGTILFYSRGEAELTGRDARAVLGRNFFTEIAPCTVVPEFYGRFRRGVLAGSLSTTFQFLFDFDMHPVRVGISMRESDRPGEYWIIVEPLEQLPEPDHAEARGLLERKFPPPGDGVALQTRSIDFSRCEAEPIAFCGAIQPFGCLLVLEPSDLCVTAVSDNTRRFLGRSSEEVLDMSLDALLPAGDDGLIEVLRAAARSGQPPRRRGFRVPPQPGFTDLSLDLRLTPWQGRWLLEIEPHAEMEPVRPSQRLDFCAFGAELLNMDDITAICERVVEPLRELTGFERVLVYRFEPNHDGVVVAESLTPDTLPSVQGLRYPATDIPRQARELYARMPLRYTPSRDHADIALLARGVQVQDIDIGAAQLRAPSPMHRGYHERFGVNGSMSISLVSDRRLWGLLIFHHRKPHTVSAGLRQRLTEFAGLLAARIALLDERGRLSARSRGMTRVNRFVGHIDVTLPFPQGFLGQEQRLRELFCADSVQIYQRNRPLLDSGGPGLNQEQTLALLGFLRGRGGGLWSTDCLSAEFEPAAEYPDQLAGVIAAFIGPAEDYVMLIGRRRTRFEILWGGNPNALPLRVEDTDAKDWPERRFEVWTETRTHHARPWSQEDLGSAEALRSLTQEVIVASAAHFEVMAMRDGLTGMPNRERFRELLADAIAEAAESGEMFGIALLDIDHFKTINDTLGHDKGDVLLRAAAGRISDALPAAAVVARLGGDEFALLLPSGSDDALDAMPRRVVQEFREPIIVGEDRFSVTVSMGITLGHGGSTGSDLLKQADMALYQAKDAGRNCVRAFDSGLQQRALARLEITRELLSRAPEAAVEILLQPQVPIAAHTATPRFEVLARWRTLAGQLLLPEDFIESARQAGLMRQITDAVLRRAVAVLRRRLESTHGATMVLSVNVSGADLEARWFARNLMAQLDQAGVPRSLLEVEINEPLLLRMTPSVRESLRQLTTAGIPIALDNFGSGFSSMGHLRELSITTLKIDRKLVRAITNEQDRRLVEGIIAMARSLGKTTVAEGVERVAELELLRRLGCDWGQGFLWSKPLPPSEAIGGRWCPTASS